MLNRLPPAEPSPLAPMAVDAGFDEAWVGVRLVLADFEAERSPKRLVEPRIAPRLAAPPPMLPVAAFVEVEPVVPRLAPVEDPPCVDEPPKELRDAELAAAVVVELDEEPEDDEDPDPDEPPRDPPPDDPPPPRWPGFIPPPLRLPRNCGAISAANRSALMVPLRRTVRCKSPITIEVVVSPVTEPPPSFFEESRSRLK